MLNIFLKPGMLQALSGFSSISIVLAFEMDFIDGENLSQYKRLS